MSTLRKVYQAAVRLEMGAKASGSRIRFADEVRSNKPQMRSLTVGNPQVAPEVVRETVWEARFEVRREGARAWSKEWLPVLTQREPLEMTV